MKSTPADSQSKRNRRPIKSSVKAGQIVFNQNRKRLVVRTTIDVGAMTFNHNRKRLLIKSRVKVGGHYPRNHSLKRLRA